MAQPNKSVFGRTHWPSTCSKKLAAAPIVLMIALCTTGCLSIGGKTYTDASPETNSRLSSLETRVGTLERTVLGTPMPAAHPTEAPSFPMATP